MAISKKVLQSTIATLLLLAIAEASTPVFAATAANESASAAAAKVPDLGELIASFKPNEMKAVAQRYQSDRASLTRFYNVPMAPDCCARLVWFGKDWLVAVQRLDPATLSEEARVERARLLETIQRDLRQVQEQARGQAEIASLVPFSKTILDLDQSRRRVDKVNAPRAADLTDALGEVIHK